MRAQIGKRAASPGEGDRHISAARQFVEQNTHRNISLREEYLYLEDVRTAMNILFLETGLNLQRRVIRMLDSGVKPEQIRQMLLDASEKYRHRLQKDYRITM
ncbi:MAG: hypothetical protein JW861_01350 [Bacteroidales bacterium]|nr:hypothetical protein [Bacteroidales bacterium]